ncbi:T9SS C-terminal target domain-containing protein [bacterium SCSIO 12741]|nr:T9SS C-terminal target domain-containing protein [bacterium SCSIO 12741]
MKLPNNPLNTPRSGRRYATMIHALNLIWVALILISCIPVFGQNVNAYATVTGIVGSTLTIDMVDETDDTFEDGEYVVIMQMQDDVIGSNTSNNSSFGNLSNIASAGLYEIRQIDSHTESGGSPNSITLTGSLSNSYNVGSNSQVQVISFPTFGSPDYTTTQELSAKAWDGNNGGVLAFQVEGVLTIAHNMSVDGLGFRGASGNGGGSTGCSGSSNYRLASTDHFADKGESIYRVSNSNYAAGQAKILNGGGGGNSHNGGGGGGSNATAGGEGGPGWPNCSPSAGGVGGISLDAHISASRIFMGGGGGAGEVNNGGSVAAGDGGGIILIRADEVRTGGVCVGRTIQADGETVTQGSGGDGNSGGGGGGSIVFQVGAWSVSATCPITVQANGGGGGDVTHAHIHGAGGGGGMGAVIYNTSEPTTNVTTNTQAGMGGINCNACGRADNGAGSNGDGIQDGITGPLPVELVEFDADVLSTDEVRIHWKTASEINNDYFELEKSTDSENWNFHSLRSGQGNTNESTEYEVIDSDPALLNYYRLKQVDFDGTATYSQIRMVQFDAKETLKSLFPLPNDGKFSLVLHASQNTSAALIVYNQLGEEVHRESVQLSPNANDLTFNWSFLGIGHYLIQAVSLDGSMLDTQPLIIR